MAYISIETAAEQLGLSTRTVRRYIAEGDLPAYRITGRRIIRLKQEDVDALFKRIPTARKE